MFDSNISSEPNKEVLVFSSVSFFGSFALVFTFCCFQLLNKYIPSNQSNLSEQNYQKSL